MCVYIIHLYEAQPYSLYVGTFKNEVKEKKIDHIHTHTSTFDRFSAPKRKGKTTTPHIP